MFRTKEFVSRTAFTLIEVMVVIFIIAILTTMTAWGLNNISIRARDTRRLADVRDIQTALMLYKQQNSYFPASLSPGSPLVSPDGRQTYMTKIPDNPNCSGPYCSSLPHYAYTNTKPNSYKLIFYIEGGVNGMASGVYEVTQKSTPPAICVPSCSGLDLGDSDGCMGTCPLYLAEPTSGVTGTLVISWTKSNVNFRIMRAGNAGMGNALLTLGKLAERTITVSGINSVPAVGDIYYPTPTSSFGTECFKLKVTARNITNGSGTIKLATVGSRTGCAVNTGSFGATYNAALVNTFGTGTLVSSSGVGDAVIPYATSTTETTATTMANNMVDVPVDGVTYNVGDVIGASYVIRNSLTTDVILPSATTTMGYVFYSIYTWIGTRSFEYNQDGVHKPNYATGTATKGIIRGQYSGGS
ncbi:MAG: prepilin-type N-terminal cleavage/methylation domain-containing protein [Candidatus Falkowbacteria bacterium]